jgi:uncharacterized OB-fold protein
MSSAADLLSAVRACGGDPLDLPFWEACREGRFLLHRCGACGRSYWPASRCVIHGEQHMAWADSSGRGTVYTYTVLHHAYTPSMKGRTPYAVVVVQLDEGPFFHAGVVDCAAEQVAVGMAVEATMVPHDSGLVVPMFRPAP